MRVPILPIAMLGLACFQTVASHTWVEFLLAESQMSKLGSAAADGVKGYMRNDQGRNTGVNLSFFHRRILDRKKDFICGERQRWPIQDEKHPRVKAKAGEKVTAFYKENGHLSLDDYSKRGPGSGPGTIFWFATDIDQRDFLLDDMLKWNKDRTGGDKKGWKVGESKFDDGWCSEKNNQAFHKARQAKWDAAKRQGNIDDCRSSFEIPKGVKSKMLTVFLVWDFSQKDTNIKNNVEWYTNCIDVDVV